jgi:hypothetical protein
MGERGRESDALAWSEREARKLRRVAARDAEDPDRVAARDASPDDVDWAGVIAEIEAIGIAELNATCILLRQAMALLLQIRGWPEHEGRSAWLIALGGVLADLTIRLTPAMRPRIDLESLYQGALGQFAGVALEGQLAQPFPSGCPFTLDDLLRGDRTQLDGLLVPNEEL